MQPRDRSTDDGELLADAGPFRTLFERSPEGMMLVDPHDPVVVGPIIACNESAAAMNGYTREELLGKPISLLTRDPESHQELKTFVDELRSMGVIAEEDIHYRKDGTPFHIEYSTVLITIGDREFMLGIDRDITRRKVLEDALAHQATHDYLTGLPNRALLRSSLGDRIDRDGQVAVLFIDLDGFKEVNDTFGHHVGDDLLRAVASRFAGALGHVGTIYRLGGDEFAVILPETDEEHAERVASALTASLREPFIIGGHALRAGASIGCAVHPKHGKDASGLMRRADMAMYSAKATRCSYTIFEQAMEQRRAARARRSDARPVAIADG